MRSRDTTCNMCIEDAMDVPRVKEVVLIASSAASVNWRDQPCTTQVGLYSGVQNTITIVLSALVRQVAGSEDVTSAAARAASIPGCSPKIGLICSHIAGI